MQETIIGIIVILTSTILTLFLVAVLYINKYFREKVVSQQQLFAAIVEAQEQERQIIACNIHDDLGGILTSTKITLSVLMEDVKSNPDIKSKLAQLQNDLGTASSIARNASNLLSPTSIYRYGLKGALSDLCDRLKQHGLNVDFRFEVAVDLPENTQINLYRIINEAMNNSLKYAQASSLYVIVQDLDDHSIQVKIGDNGMGFNWKEKLVTSKSKGLQNMENRCKLLNAEMFVESTPEIGTHIQIAFKL